MSEKPRNANLWTVRLLAVLLAASTVSVVVMAVAVASLFPIKEIRPFAVNFANRSEMVAVIAPVTERAGGFDALARSLARQYVIMRHSITASSAEMEQRWRPETGIIFLQSTPEIYRKFLSEAQQVYQVVQASDATVSIDVRSVSTIEPGRKYQVDFNMESRDRTGKVRISKEFVATMDVDFLGIRTQVANQTINPTGFTVTSYTNVEKGS